MSTQACPICRVVSSGRNARARLWWGATGARKRLRVGPDATTWPNMTMRKGCGRGARTCRSPSHHACHSPTARADAPAPLTPKDRLSLRRGRKQRRVAHPYISRSHPAVWRRLDQHDKSTCRLAVPLLPYTTPWALRQAPFQPRICMCIFTRAILP